MESCDESGDGCWADDPDGESCTDGLCEAGNCIQICSAPQSCRDGCTDIVSGRNDAEFTYTRPAKLCIAENARWTGRVRFRADGTLEVCGWAAPSRIDFDAAIGALNVRATGTLQIRSAPRSAVDNEGLVVVTGSLDLDPGQPWTNRGRIEVGNRLDVDSGCSLNLDSDSLVVVGGTFENTGIVDGIGSTCGLVRIEGSNSHNENSGTIQNNADVCPLTRNNGRGPEIRQCSCNPTLACGL
jgi:hypothetical protein